MSVVAPMFEGRRWLHRIVRTGERRLGGTADVVILQLVGREDGPQIGGSESPPIEGFQTAEFAAKLAAGWGGARSLEEASGAPAEDAPAEEVEGSKNLQLLRNPLQMTPPEIRLLRTDHSV